LREGKSDRGGEESIMVKENRFPLLNPKNQIIGTNYNGNWGGWKTKLRMRGGETKPRMRKGRSWNWEWKRREN